MADENSINQPSAALKSQGIQRSDVEHHDASTMVVMAPDLTSSSASQNPQALPLADGKAPPGSTSMGVQDTKPPPHSMPDGPNMAACPSLAGAVLSSTSLEPESATVLPDDAANTANNTSGVTESSNHKKATNKKKEKKDKKPPKKRPSLPLPYAAFKYGPPHTHHQSYLPHPSYHMYSHHHACPPPPSGPPGSHYPPPPHYKYAPHPPHYQFAPHPTQAYYAPYPAYPMINPAAVSAVANPSSASRSNPNNTSAATALKTKCTKTKKPAGVTPGEPAPHDFSLSFPASAPYPAAVPPPPPPSRPSLVPLASTTACAGSAPAPPSMSGLANTPVYAGSSHHHPPHPQSLAHPYGHLPHYSTQPPSHQPQAPSSSDKASFFNGQRWTKDDDDKLRSIVESMMLASAAPSSSGGKSGTHINWKVVADQMEGRSDQQCMYRWQKSLRPDVTKGPWTEEEDVKVVELVRKHGAKRWSLIASQLPGRIGKQCRERWHNHLNPEISKEAWKREEDLRLLECHVSMGNKWAEIAKLLPGRYANER